MDFFLYLFHNSKSSKIRSIHWLLSNIIFIFLINHSPDPLAFLPERSSGFEYTWHDKWIKLYFKKVIDWVEAKFPNYRKEMKGLPWGIFYNNYSHNNLDANTLENEIKKLMEDEDITSKKGIYEYILSDKNIEKVLNIRSYDDKQKREAYERQNGICVKCEKDCDYSNMQGDHIIPWSKNGKTINSNCQMLCSFCNGTKSNN